MRTIIVALICIVTAAAYAGDTAKREDIINSILNESLDSSQERRDTSSDTAERRSDADGSGTSERDKESREGKAPAVTGEEEELLRTGIQFYNSGYLDHSLEKFQELVKKFPQSEFLDQSRVWIGKIHLNKYRYNEAIKEFSAVPADSGEYPSAVYYIGESYFRMGNIISSIENFRRVSSRFPSHELADNALLRIGKLYLGDKKGNQALESIIGLIKYYKDRETIDEAYYLLGRLFEQDPGLKDIETARRVYKLFIKKAESNNKYFVKSPLLPRVKRDLARLEKRYFKLEN